MQDGCAPFKVLSGLSQTNMPAYMLIKLQIRCPSRVTRQTTEGLLTEQKPKLKYRDHSFSTVVWRLLDPQANDVRNINQITNYKRKPIIELQHR